jgi:hypothetical protein
MAMLRPPSSGRLRTPSMLLLKPINGGMGMRGRKAS